MIDLQDSLSGYRSIKNVKHFLELAILAALFALVCVAPSDAQLTGKGAITGTVADATGAVVPGATIAATNTGNGITSSTVSTGTGNFTFSNLDPGIYTVTTTASGFEKVTQENIHVNAMESQAYNPVLTVGSQSDVVTVSAEPPQLETSNATLGATLEQETYSELPIEMGAFGSADQRRATDFVYLMPGVQGNETNGNATTNTGVVNGSGSRGAVSDVYIDGIPYVRAGGNGDPRYVWTAISVDAVDQFQLQTTGYSAIYEGQGVMNYSIKQGGSSLHGAVYEFFRNTALDTWGFWGKVPNAATGLPVKPVEHSNEYGINLGGPLIPFGALKNKLFFFTNYNGFRYSSATPTPMTFPTAAELAGDFRATGVNIYDPLSQTSCTAGNAGVPCRNQFIYNGNLNVIPPNEMSKVAVNMQSFLSQIPAASIGSTFSNNYVASNSTGLVNWSTTSRIDYVMNSHDTFSVLAAVGRQASSVPVGQTTAGRNVGPVPYNYGQAYAPKTAVWSLEETHIFSPNLLNQLKWGYARYNGPTFNPADTSKYSAATMGITATPTGQASNEFPIVTFSGTDAPTNWGGTTENSTVAENYTVLDNVQWNKGKHSFTIGGQVAWLLYNVNNATKGGSTPLTLATASTETAQLVTASGSTTANSKTGLAYASFLMGEIDTGSFTQYLQQEFGARFRAISPYVQDNWKINKKLTLDVGLRYDFFPSLKEVHNAESLFNPYLTNPVTGLPGALQYTGFGANNCNCATPVSSYKSNYGPRLGAAYQLDSKTVVRASYGVMFTHGDAVGGLNTSLGTLGFSAAISDKVNGSFLSTFPLLGTSGAIPAYTPATGAASGPAYGTGYTNTSGYTGSPLSGSNFDDPYLGSRAPEYINWSFGLQRQLTRVFALTVTYVGSQGHFLQSDDTGNIRGYWADQLDPKYLLTVNTHLADKGTAIATDCANPALGITCPSNALMNTGQPLSQFLKPYPFQSVTDNFAYVGNSNYNALQVLVNMRSWHGLTLNVNYSKSRAIDDAGYFRSGYAIPAGTINGNPAASYPQDRIERGVSTSDQPQHFVTTAVWNTPLGRTILASNSIERGVLGGFAFSGVFQAFSGSPLSISAASCQTNPAIPNASKFCPPTLNPTYTGHALMTKWGQGLTTGNAATLQFVDPTAFTTTPNYLFGNTPRTGAYNLYGPHDYQLDLAMLRSFPLHITEATKLNFRAEWYNVANYSLFTPTVSNGALQFGSSSFGTLTASPVANRKAAQFSARVEF